MLDLDLDQRLRDEFRSTADHVEASPRLDGLVRDRLARRQMQRRITLGGGAALGLALVVGITAALAGNNGPDSVVMSPTDADRDGRGGVNADASADADLDTDAGVTADADVTAPVTVPPGTNAPTSPLPDGVPAVPGAETVTGTFAGALSKVPSALPGPGCQVEASFDPVLTLADGKTWNAHVTYCVAGVGGVGGTSEFAVDMPNGDSMTGELDLAATGSGLGLFAITGGTGAYAQATGYCQLDGWATDLTSLGTFDKVGSFSCSIAGVASQ